MQRDPEVSVRLRLRLLSAWVRVRVRVSAWVRMRFSAWVRVCVGGCEMRINVCVSVSVRSVRACGCEVMRVLVC